MEAVIKRNIISNKKMISIPGKSVNKFYWLWMLSQGLGLNLHILPRLGCLENILKLISDKNYHLKRKRRVRDKVMKESKLSLVGRMIICLLLISTWSMLSQKFKIKKKTKKPRDLIQKNQKTMKLQHKIVKKISWKKFKWVNK